MIKYFPETESRPARLSYWCSACDHRWAEKPLYAREDKVLSNQEVKEIIEMESLGYAVTDYMSGKDIKDPKLRELWAMARKALRALETYLEKVETTL